MPIHLPAISRRQFLSGSLAAGLLLPRSSWAADAPADPNRWALMADTHIWQRRNGVQSGVNMAANFSQAGREILALDRRPAGAIVAGDCAFMQGDAADYAVLVDLVKPIRAGGIPMHFALGNHDHHGNFRRTVADQRPPGEAVAAVPGKYVSVLETLHANWFLLDSLEKPPAKPDSAGKAGVDWFHARFQGASSNWVAGSLGKAQLDWLAKALDARADKPAILLDHHYLSLARGLRDTAALLEVIEPRKQVKAVVFGHSHTWQRSHWQGIHLINLPAVAWVFDPAQPSGWVDMQLAPNGATLVLHCLDRRHPKQGERVELKWRRNA
jgi:3',5'-cyclic AMP phosphodiesterase CpdA